MSAGGTPHDRQDQGLLGQWLAQHQGSGDEPVAPRPAPGESDDANFENPDSEAPPTDDDRQTIATAGAVPEAFAAGTLEVEDEPSPTEQGREPKQRDGADAMDDQGDRDDGDGATPPPPRHPEPAPTPAARQVTFHARTGARRVLGLLTIVSLAATGLVAWRAYDDRTPMTLGAAVALAVLTLALWVARSTRSVAQLTISGSRLEIVRAGTRMVFDLADPNTDVQLIGTPGRRGWRVVFPRRGLDPAVIDDRMVNPREFIRLMEFHGAQARDDASHPGPGERPGT